MEKAKRKKKGAGGNAIDRIFGREEKSSVPRIIDENRKVGEEIAAALQTVDFSKLKNKEGMTEEQLTGMRASVKALIMKIQEAPTIFDDISKLDTILLYAAEALKTAAGLGYVNQAEWCINALSNALLFLRDNIPPHLQDNRESIIEDRVRYMEKYRELIRLYGEIDEASHSIRTKERTLQEYREEYAPKRQQVIELREKEPETLAKLKANENTPGNLGEREKDLLLLLTATGSLAGRIALLVDERFTLLIKKEADLTAAGDFKAALENKPELYGQDLSAEYAALLKQISEDMNRRLNEAAAIASISKEAERERKAIMNGPAAQALVGNALGVEETLTAVDKIPAKETQALQEIKHQNEQRRQQEQKNRNMQAQMNATAEEIKNQEIDFDMLQETQTDKDETVQTDTNEQGNAQYNLNS